jgi:hypothetical protein
MNNNDKVGNSLNVFVMQPVNAPVTIAVTTATATEIDFTLAGWVPNEQVLIEIFANALRVNVDSTGGGSFRCSGLWLSPGSYQIKAVDNYGHEAVSTFTVS